MFKTGGLHYMVTYKKLRNDPVPLESDYTQCAFLLQQKCHIMSRSFETDSKDKLHVHYVCRFPRNPYVRGLIIKGFNVNVTPIYDLENLAGYLNKQCSNEFEERQLLDLIFIKNNYVLGNTNDSVANYNEESSGLKDN